MLEWILAIVAIIGHWRSWILRHIRILWLAIAKSIIASSTVLLSWQWLGQKWIMVIFGGVVIIDVVHRIDWQMILHLFSISECRGGAHWAIWLLWALGSSGGMVWEIIISGKFLKLFAFFSSADTMDYTICD